MPFDRAKARESKIWTPFIYSATFSAKQITERTTIFGLYSYSYNNRHIYLLDIETTDLANLLSDYNAKISGLTNEETITVNSIVAKRYLAGVEKAIHDQGLITKEQKVSADSAELEAKIAALSADRGELATLATRVATETTKAAARLVELEAQKGIEDVNLDLQEVENTEKEIQVEKVKLQVLDVANDVLKVQIAIVEAGVDLVETDVRISRIRIEISKLNEEIDKTDILELQHGITVRQKEIIVLERDILQNELDMLETRRAFISGTEAAYTNLWKGYETADLTKELSLVQLKYNSRKQSLGITIDKTNNDIARIKSTRGNELDGMASDNAVRSNAVTAQSTIFGAQQTAATLEAAASIDAATTLAKADIANTLTHVISAGV